MIEGTAEVRDVHRFDVSALERYLSGRVEGFRGPLGVRQFRGGQSNPTYYLEAGGREYVLRRKPPGKLLPSAHAVDREYRVLAALAAHTTVPVPKPYLLCEDDAVIGTMFYVMDYVHGRIFRDANLGGATPAERRAIYDSMNDVLARLHLVDWKAVGLAEFGRPGDYYARQIHRWSQQYRASETEKIEAMERLMEWLPKNIPASAETTLVHGDYRPGNMIVHPSEPRVVAVLDWELSTLGHPMADLASTCMPYHLGNEWEGLRDAPLAELGIPTEAEYSPRTAAAPGVPASSTGTSTSRSPSSGWPPSRRGSWDASSPAPPTTPTRASAASARARWPKPAGASWSRAWAERRCASGRSGHLEQARRAHAAADAHGADDVARAAALALDERVADHARAAHAVRMADGDGAAVDVQLLHRDSELVAAVDHLHGERLVQLPEIDLAHRDAGALEQARHGEDGPDPHLVRLAGGDGETAEDPERVQPAAFGQLRVHDDARRGAVRELAGVARGDVALLAGDRLERREALGRRVGPVALVLLEQGVLDARLPARLVDHDLLRRHRHDLGVEAARLLPGGRALLAGQRGPVLPLAGDVVAVAHDLRRLDHRHVDLGLVLLQPLLAQAVQVPVVVLHGAERLEATRHPDQDPFHDHPLRGDRHPR